MHPQGLLPPEYANPRWRMGVRTGVGHRQGCPKDWPQGNSSYIISGCGPFLELPTGMTEVRSQTHPMRP